MIIKILSCAENELVEIVDYYNGQCPGLGFEFAAEVKSAFQRMVSFPDAWPVFSKRSKRFIINKFPYGILYQIREDSILILAIMHLRREPKKWQEKLKNLI